MNTYEHNTHVGFTKRFRGALAVFAVFLFATVGAIAVGMYTTSAATSFYTNSGVKEYFLKQREEFVFSMLSDRQRGFIETIVSDNAKLTVQNAELKVALDSTVSQLKVAVAAQTQAEHKLATALVSESSVGEAVNNRIYQPTKLATIQAAETTNTYIVQPTKQVVTAMVVGVKEASTSAYDSVRNWFSSN